MLQRASCDLDTGEDGDDDCCGDEQDDDDIDNSLKQILIFLMDHVYIASIVSLS